MKPASKITMQVDVKISRKILLMKTFVNCTITGQKILNRYINYTI